MIRVEVAYALPSKQKIVALDVEQGASVVDVVERSGIAAEFPELDIGNAKMGVFGKAIQAESYQLRDGDRIEIYRPLLIDPKASRKERAAKAQATKKG